MTKAHLSAETFLNGLTKGSDGIYSYVFNAGGQQAERELREKTCREEIGDYMGRLARHHSIPVMDREVGRFLRQIPRNGKVIDVGGCWGWHWRKIARQRPDVTVVIVDFIRDNLRHAQNLLNDLINQQVTLVHGDAADLRFGTATFDGYWSVQTWQHIPDLQKTAAEARRVLKPSGHCAVYFLNDEPLMKLAYKIRRRPYVRCGNLANGLFLRRASREIHTLLEGVFNTKVTQRYCEVLFHPELNFLNAGREKSPLGQIDRLLCGSFVPLSWLARQRSYHAQLSL